MNYQHAYEVLERTIKDEINSLESELNKGSEVDDILIMSKIEVLYKVLRDFFEIV